MEYLPQLVGNNLRDALAEGSNLISALMPEDIVGETVVGNGSPSFQKFLDTTINSREETPMKKLLSAAIAAFITSADTARFTAKFFFRTP